MVDPDPSRPESTSPLEPGLAKQAAASHREIAEAEPPSLIALRKLSQRELLVAIDKHAKFQSSRNGGLWANFGSCDLSYLDLRDITLIGAELSGSNLQNAGLRRRSFPVDPVRRRSQARRFEGCQVGPG
jgi:hypothetical protein